METGEFKKQSTAESKRIAFAIMSAIAKNGSKKPTYNKKLFQNIEKFVIRKGLAKPKK